MRILVVYCHPCPESFNAAIKDHVLAVLTQRGDEVRLRDLYAEDFDPVLSAAERRAYHTHSDNERAIASHLADLRWCEALIFVYPTWWYGLPAMLKGWLDRVFVPHATFTMPVDRNPIGRVLTNIRVVMAISTLGCPRWWWWFIGAPGQRTLLTGIGALLHPRCRKSWIALHTMDSTTPGQRARFLDRVESRLRSLGP